MHRNSLSNNFLKKWGILPKFKTYFHFYISKGSIQEIASDKFLSRDSPQFSRDSVDVYWNVLKCFPIRSLILGRRYVPILKTFLRFLQNLSLGGVEPPEGLENEKVPDILIQCFLEISD
jgi:hypothetical protein